MSTRQYPVLMSCCDSSLTSSQSPQEISARVEDVEASPQPTLFALIDRPCPAHEAIMILGRISLLDRAVAFKYKLIWPHFIELNIYLSILFNRSLCSDTPIVIYHNMIVLLSLIVY